MTKYKIYVSEPAEKDLKDMVKYIALQLSAPVSAIRMMELLEEAMSGLSESPRGCPLIAEECLSRLGYRKLMVRNYIIFFSVSEKEKVVDIERVLYARCDWLRII